MSSNLPPDPPPDPAAPHKLARIRQAVLEFGRLAWSDETVIYPDEVHRFLGRAGVILDIEDREYRS